MLNSFRVGPSNSYKHLIWYVGVTCALLQTKYMYVYLANSDHIHTTTYMYTSISIELRVAEHKCTTACTYTVHILLGVHFGG